jgi:hypothetical protein
MLGPLDRHLQPDAALLARLVLRAHAHLPASPRASSSAGSTAWLVTSCGGTTWPT